MEINGKKTPAFFNRNMHHIIKRALFIIPHKIGILLKCHRKLSGDECWWD